jgi:tetratricopeptide (TPR) repeat protein
MACSAMDVQPGLDFEQDEEAIFNITEDLPIDMEIEDSGSLEGLRSRLAKEQYDVLYLSGYVGIEKGRPYFIMENETGYSQKVSPKKLWQKALMNNPLRLLFLSGCRLHQVPAVLGTSPIFGNSTSGAFAWLLVEEFDMPAVLGWDLSVGDSQTIHAGKIFFSELSCGRSLLDAVQRVRYKLKESNSSSTLNPTWSQLRLFSSGMPLNAIVKKDQKPQPKPQRIKRVYLQNSQVQVLAEGFVGRRRQLQTCLKVLRQDYDKVGVVLLGAGGLGKSCLAGKICERFTSHILIIVKGKLNAISLNTALKDAFILARDKKGQQILSQRKGITEKLTDLCAFIFRKKNYLLLLDDFEQNLEGADKGKPGALLPEAADLLKVLLHYLPFSDKMTQLIITSRFDFSLTEQEKELVKEQLGKVWLTGFDEAELRKKIRGLKNILNYADSTLLPNLSAAGHGNPRLMEWLDILVGQMATAEVPQLVEAVKDKQEEFIRGHVIRELLLRGGKKLELFLRCLSIYRRPVKEEGVKKVAEKSDLIGWKELLDKGVSFSLIEHDQARRSYQVTPLLREELLKGFEDRQACHEAACVYYKNACEFHESFDSFLTEELIFHAFSCGEKGVATRQGGNLINYFRENLAFQESQRVGEWILSKKNRFSNEGDADLLNAFGSTVRVLGDYRKAIECFMQALTICRKVFDEKHSRVAVCLNNLGSAWSDLGDHEKAFDYIKQALDILMKLNEESLPDAAVTLNYLGLEWQALGHPRKAIDCFNQALFIDRSLHGEMHPTVARDWNKMGSVRQLSGHYREAIKCFKEALTIYKKVYSEKHPDVAIQLNSLGLVWSDLGDHNKAFDYFNQALHILMGYYEERHPDVADTLNYLGLEWLALDHPLKAFDRFKQALLTDLSVYGEMHPSAARDWYNMGLARQVLGHHQEATKCFKQAHEIFIKFFGPEHSKTKKASESLKACE